MLLMLISALDGAIGVALEAARYAADPEGSLVDLAAVFEGVGVQLMLGKVCHAQRAIMCMRGCLGRACLHM